jgi:hypothetical protein
MLVEFFWFSSSLDLFGSEVSTNAATYFAAGLKGRAHEAATKDIDAIFHPPEVVAPFIAQVARELGLPEDWMNSGVESFAARHEERIAFAQLQIPGLTVTRPSAKYLLAMKCRAGRLPTPFRAGDMADIAFLLRELSIRSITEVDAITAEFYGTPALEPGKRWLVEQLLLEVRRG